MSIVSPEFEVKPLNGVITVGLGKPSADSDLIAVVAIRQDQVDAISGEADVIRIDPCAKGDDFGPGRIGFKRFLYAYQSVTQVLTALS